MTWRGTCPECGRRYQTDRQGTMTRHDAKGERAGVCRGAYCEPVEGTHRNGSRKRRARG